MTYTCRWLDERPPSFGVNAVRVISQITVRCSVRLRTQSDGLPGGGMSIPGLGTNGNSVSTLRKHCRSLGYDAFDWGQGFNTGPKGDFDAWLQNLKSQVVDLLADHSQRATLIGWSLGGLYAREIGKLMPRRVRQVITIGTPFNAEADHTNVGWLFRLLSGSSSGHDKRSRLAHDIEVEGSHIGMGWNRHVLAAVADRLGQQTGPWRQYMRAD